MRNMILVLTLGLMLIAGNLYATGDLTVTGNLGVGTDTPQQKLDVRGSIQVLKQNWEGIYFDNRPVLIWRPYNGGSPAINSNSLVIGTDDYISEIYWDTFRDGGWAFCEGITGLGASVKCPDYSAIGMTNNDYFFVWKHGVDTRYATTADLKFVFDGESNDGVMGFMEDEDAFFFDEKLGIGTRTPTAKLQVTGGDAYTSTAGNGLIVKSPNGAICKRIGIDNSGNIVATSVTCP